MGWTIGNVYSEVMYEDEEFESCVYLFYKLVVLSEYAEFDLKEVVTKKYELDAKTAGNKSFAVAMGKVDHHEEMAEEFYDMVGETVVDKKFVTWLSKIYRQYSTLEVKVSGANFQSTETLALLMGKEYGRLMAQFAALENADRVNETIFGLFLENVANLFVCVLRLYGDANGGYFKDVEAKLIP